jgi:hypothetical protein
MPRQPAAKPSKARTPPAERTDDMVKGMKLQKCRSM